jgi:cyclophilin family peptidyl-prolyl cis-trans isomerase
MRSALLLLGLPLLAAPPSFGVREAIRAEWRRQPPVFRDAERAQLPPADRARLELTLQRIGATGAPALLPPELDKPTLEAWEAKAVTAKTPQERFTALFFLNRLKSTKALMALDGLGSEDAKTWPKHLHLEASIATARLNGCEVSPALQDFLEGLGKAGKIDPVREQAARLRLVMGGKEKELLPPVKATPGAVLALMDAWNRGPWDKRRGTHLGMLEFLKADPYFERGQQPDSIGFNRDTNANLERADLGLSQRLLEGIEGQNEPQVMRSLELAIHPKKPMQVRIAALSALAKWPGTEMQISDIGGRVAMMLLNSEALFDMATLPFFRKFSPDLAEMVRTKYISGSDPIARAAAIDDMAEAPADLDALITRLWKTEEYDGVQVLLQSLGKWKLPEDRRKAILQRFYDHPCWTARLDAWRELSKLDPKAPWPSAPAPSVTDKAILREAERLAMAGKPVRMRLTFAGKRQVTLRLDPVNAPMNVANLVLLARKGFFNGRLVPRVVPDFVVQMGSPCDTMDGGPGYTVRCENSLTWYGPGSVGMALSGKDTGGSQFFITTNATPHLTGKYTRVGEVEDPDKALKLLDDLELGAKLERVDVLAPGMKR